MRGLRRICTTFRGACFRIMRRLSRHVRLLVLGHGDRGRSIVAQRVQKAGRGKVWAVGTQGEMQRSKDHREKFFFFSSSAFDVHDDDDDSIATRPTDDSAVLE